MRAIEFPEANEVFAKNQPQYNTLPVYKKENDPQGLVVSKWTFTPEEFKRVFESGAVHLSLLTFGQPLQPIMLSVDFPGDKEPTRYESQSFGEIVAEVLRIRKTHIKKGYTIEQDLQLNYGAQLSYVAGFLCHCHLNQMERDELRQMCPPNWNIGAFMKLSKKPYRERLIIAAGLLVSEIDRIDNGGNAYV